MIDWNKVIEQACATAAIVVPAVIGGMIKLRKLDKGQQTMQGQLNGHTKLLRRASRAQGILEGHDKAKQEVKKDLADVVSTVQKVQKRRARKSDPE